MVHIATFLYMSSLNEVNMKVHMTKVTIHDCYLYCHVIIRMQKLAQEQNEKIEKVNRERKFHQVSSIPVIHITIG